MELPISVNEYLGPEYEVQVPYMYYSEVFCEPSALSIETTQKLISSNLNEIIINTINGLKVPGTDPLHVTKGDKGAHWQASFRAPGQTLMPSFCWV